MPTIENREISIRPATPSDLDNILSLFKTTIQTVNSRDYSDQQIAVWSSKTDKHIWQKKIADQNFIIAEKTSQILGFSSIDLSGYIDFMYVHFKYQRMGIATDLLRRILDIAISQRNKRVWASVSITALPFFKSKGFIEVRKENKSVENVSFTNSIMEKTVAKNPYRTVEQ